MNRKASQRGEDEALMRIALGEARKGLGHTSPNPAVGAVLARGGTVLTTGYHSAAGQAHAEVAAIANLPDRKLARECTLYVTLEPCSTQGKTPPCVETIITSGIKRVVVGANDPNPRHAGRGLDLLRHASIPVVTGVLEGECTRLNEAFNQWIVTRQPFVIAKAAMSINGKMYRPQGEDRWITSPAARHHAHETLRSRVDAILIGGNTLRQDNPHLTARGLGDVPTRSKQPWRVVWTASGNLPPQAHLFTDAYRDRTLIYRGTSLRAVLQDLGEKQVLSVLIEGGPRLLSTAFAERLVDKVQLYFAPLFIGNSKETYGLDSLSALPRSIALRDIDYQQIERDLCLTAYPVYDDGHSELSNT